MKRIFSVCFVAIASLHHTQITQCNEAIATKQTEKTRFMDHWFHYVEVVCYVTCCFSPCYHRCVKQHCYNIMIRLNTRSIRLLRFEYILQATVAPYFSGRFLLLPYFPYNFSPLACTNYIVQFYLYIIFIYLVCLYVSF